MSKIIKEVYVWVKDNQTFSDGTPMISMKEQHGHGQGQANTNHRQIKRGAV